jgi:isoleucyl-tRNA synthetase
VHLRSYDLVPADWHNDAIAAKWAQIRKARQVVMSALEIARNDGKIGASLQATPMVYISADMQAAFAGQDAASLFITSSATLSSDAAPGDAFRLDTIDDIAVVVAVADGEKCARCWKITPEVTADVDICGRCHDVVSAQS